MGRTRVALLCLLCLVLGLAAGALIRTWSDEPEIVEDPEAKRLAAAQEERRRLLERLDENLARADELARNVACKRLFELTGLSADELLAAEALDLSGTRFTDDDLEHLDALPRLARVDLRDTAVTREGVARFQESHPDCEIETGRDRPPR